MWFKEWYGKTARLALLLINYLGIGIIQLFSFSHEERGKNDTSSCFYVCFYPAIVFLCVW